MKKHQVLVIHGGGNFAGTPREKLIEELKSITVDIERLRRGEDWKGVLQKNLGDEYDVLAPRMPNPDQPLFEEWKVWFEQIIPVLDEEVILVGHSLGALFLIKYLSENNLGKDIRGVFLIAPPYKGGDEEWRFRESGFVVGDDLSRLSQAEAVFLYHSHDDKVVPFSEFEILKEKIPNITAREFSDRGHFTGNNFPEIVEDIKGL